MSPQDTQTVTLHERTYIMGTFQLIPCMNPIMSAVKISIKKVVGQKFQSPQLGMSPLCMNYEIFEIPQLRSCRHIYTYTYIYTYTHTHYYSSHLFLIWEHSEGDLKTLQIQHNFPIRKNQQPRRQTFVTLWEEGIQVYNTSKRNCRDSDTFSLTI